MITDFLLFKRMLIPYLIQILFWLGVIATLVAGIFNLFHGLIWQGLTLIFIGPLVLRLVAEYIIVLFRINETLLDIKDELRANSKPSFSIMSGIRK